MKKTGSLLLFFLLTAITFAGCSPIKPTNVAAPTGDQLLNCSDSPCQFQLNNDTLTINTKTMNVVINGAAITYVKDKISGNVLVDSAANINLPPNINEFIGFTSQTVTGKHSTKYPTGSSLVSFTSIDINHGQLTYSSLGPQKISNKNSLMIDITIDQLTGEIVIQLTGDESDTSLEPISIDLPIINITTPSIILGNGAMYGRTDPDAIDQTTNSRYGLYSPTMAVIQGSNAVMAIWSETTEFDPEYIRLLHKSAYDQVILHGEKSAAQTDSQTIVSPPWRIGTYRTWTEAAKRWREKFEQRTDAKPLWENPTPWVRNIHAVFDATSQDYGENIQRYSELASKTPPQNTLFLLWNGDRIVLFGDLTLADKIARPTPDSLRIIKSYGWPLVLYFPYNLIYSDQGTKNRLQFLENNHWLPTNYQFKPDYKNSPEDWQNYWSDIKVNYEDGTKFYVLHPGSKNFNEYIIRYLSDYSSLYETDGAYFDTLGVDHDYFFPKGMKIMNGEDYVLGEIRIMQTIREKLPNLAVMSEYQSPWLLPYVFYSWEGSATHISQNALGGTRINHPLRLALTGSYSWTRESNEENNDDVISALMGALPQVSLEGDIGIGSEKALWSQAQAKLFCDEELFNDLPTTWDNDAIAYYKSMRTGRWFKFKYTDSSYGYYEILPNGTEIPRLIKP